MKSISRILMVITVLLSAANSFAQSKNTKTETIKIYGNCGMCKKTIEKAGNVKNAVTVEWNKDTKMATLSYDNKKTNVNEILKRIALAGYDSEKFLAPDNVYAKLPGCCQYERALKPIPKKEKPERDMKIN
ncbi:heavy-metal-associated domain-containing protein [Sphingobacterium sp. SGG-5]|uniref:heavy-metal-associated domain-containing protein n=1 Tax=Sphingobacterium sp. SGG-5 TaxID=2710881 RepID=UPI0019D2EEB1|nr:ATPase [Sphingobacterium sp. SGG-5]